MQKRQKIKKPRFWAGPFKLLFGNADAQFFELDIIYRIGRFCQRADSLRRFREGNYLADRFFSRQKCGNAVQSQTDTSVGRRTRAGSAARRAAVAEQSSFPRQPTITELKNEEFLGVPSSGQVAEPYQNAPHPSNRHQDSGYYPAENYAQTGLNQADYTLRAPNTNKPYRGSYGGYNSARGVALEVFFNIGIFFALGQKSLGYCSVQAGGKRFQLFA